MARRYDSEAVRNRVLSTSVRLFLERGYHGTTMAAILKEADVSSSSFQNVFGNKAGVMYELMKLMFLSSFRQQIQQLRCWDLMLARLLRMRSRRPSSSPLPN